MSRPDQRSGGVSVAAVVAAVVGAQQIGMAHQAAENDRVQEQALVEAPERAEQGQHGGRPGAGDEWEQLMNRRGR